ncbi:hypothetical protein BO94DRAFT_507593 [Aspergillus sclerotioniger CBS 115572]|uniref:CRAL-TRIO domain-containing protein n=1 Tax=Aspergillus sclerotioniger CBS 115572 TaxID=1450535 RepID=A0A317XD71_9EURO|nr:hypothetical protein BO94DRAFT_507593 [Aspergillus sclerotioniger CBS 115572]PWY96101.1 hypothetical protein BO94DRAFT_507593 [Aspergillus sclerotioniger CBS 115572]
MVIDSRPRTFRDLVRKHTDFLVNPLQWTSRHLDLVGSRFDDIAIIPPYTDSTTSACPDTGRQPPNDAETLARNIFPDVKCRSLIKILVGKGLLNSKGTSLWFQGRRVHRPRYLVFHPRKESLNRNDSTSPSFVGYVHYTDVVGDRRRQFEPCSGPRGVNNRPGIQLCLKKVAQTTPKDWTEDAYFMCHLLALAHSISLNQLRILYVSACPALHPSLWSLLICFLPRLLVTHGQEREYIFLYEADIPTELLDGLWNPKDATSPMKWPTIRREKIPYEPFDTFSSRLVAELVAPSHSPSHDPMISSDGPSCVTSRKRSHEEETGGKYKIPRPSE